MDGKDFENFKREVLFLNRREKSDKINFSRLKKQLDIEKVDLKKLYLDNLYPELTDPNVENLRLIEAVIEGEKWSKNMEDKLDTFNRQRQNSLNKKIRLQKNQRNTRFRSMNLGKSVNYNLENLQKEDNEEEKLSVGEKLFRVMENHPEIFNIPNFIQTRKKNKRKMEDEQRHRAMSEHSKVPEKKVVVELTEK